MDEPIPGDDGLIRPLAEVEREAVERALRLYGGNVPRAASALGISPSTLYRKKNEWEPVAATAKRKL